MLTLCHFYLEYMQHTTKTNTPKGQHMPFDTNNKKPDIFCNGCPKHCSLGSRFYSRCFLYRPAIDTITIYDFTIGKTTTLPLYGTHALAHQMAHQLTKYCIHHRDNPNKIQPQDSGLSYIINGVPFCKLSEQICPNNTPTFTTKKPGKVYCDYKGCKLYKNFQKLR